MTDPILDELIAVQIDELMDRIIERNLLKSGIRTFLFHLRQVLENYDQALSEDELALKIEDTYLLDDVMKRVNEWTLK